jgi:hypothetical protein
VDLPWEGMGAKREVLSRQRSMFTVLIKCAGSGKLTSGAGPGITMGGERSGTVMDRNFGP